MDIKSSYGSELNIEILSKKERFSLGEFINIGLVVMLCISANFFDIQIGIPYLSPPILLSVLLTCISFLRQLRNGRVLAFDKTVSLWIYLIILSMALSSIPTIIGGLDVTKVFTQMARMSTGIMTAWAVAYSFEKVDLGIKALVTGFSLAGLVSGAIGLMQWIDFNVLHRVPFYITPTVPTYQLAAANGAYTAMGSLVYRISGAYGEPSWFGLYTSLLLMVSLGFLFGGAIEIGKNLKKLLSISAIVMFLTLIISRSLTGIGLAVIANMITAILFIPLRRSRPILHRVLLLLIVAAVVGGTILYVVFTHGYLAQRIPKILDLTDPSVVQRLGTFKQAIQLWSYSPFIGIGVGQYSLAEVKYLSNYIDVSIDSGWLLVLAETGLFGFLSYFGFLFYLCRKLFKHYTRSAFVMGSVIVYLFIELISLNDTYSVFIWILIGFSILLLRTNNSLSEGGV
ncbi:MAG: O-antigen ligase family protein [Acidibacillus sp.]|nr:O-antigen ligase family protein [Acidibacillus sp.]